MTPLRFRILPFCCKIGWFFGGEEGKAVGEQWVVHPALSRLQQLVECGSGRGSCWAGEGSVLDPWNLSRGEWSDSLPCETFDAFRHQGKYLHILLQSHFSRIMPKNSLSPLWLCWFKCLIEGVKCWHEFLDTFHLFIDASTRPLWETAEHCCGRGRGCNKPGQLSQEGKELIHKLTLFCHLPGTRKWGQPSNQ